MSLHSAIPMAPTTPQTSLEQRVAGTALQVDRLGFKNIFFHTDKIQEYLTTGDAYPLHILLGMTDYCNHSCRWCYTAYSTHDDRVMERNGELVQVSKTRNDRIIEPEALLRFISDAHKRGLKGATLVGSGEPLLHPQSAEIITALGEMGIDIGLFTNGNILKEAHFESLLKYASYVRFSIDAADPETYAKLHGGGATFDKTIANLRRLVEARNKSGRRLPTIGAQFVTSQLNADSMVPFAELMRDVGVDYVAYKPMYDNVMNPDRARNTMSIAEAHRRLAEVKQYETADFTIYDKGGKQFEEAWNPRGTNGASYYQTCQAHQFSCALYASGEIYLCVNLAGRKEYVLGNIYEQTLEQIWASPQRRQAIEGIDLCEKCPAGCHLDPLNKIMWDITHPDPEIHPNFL